MASFIWTCSRQQMKYFEVYPSIDQIRKFVSNNKVVIAKGNIIEGIEAKE